MVLQLAILVCLAAVSKACVYTKHPGLYANYWQDNTQALVSTSPWLMKDENAAAGQSIDIDLTNDFDIMNNGRKVRKLRVCDTGTINTAQNGGTLEACKTLPQIQAIDTSGGNAEAVIVADALGTTLTSYFVSTYHAKRPDQFDASNNVTGPSLCDINILEGIINDCLGESRQDISIEEMVVVTWNAQYSASMNYTFQAFLAFSNASKTYVGFLFEDTPTIATNQNRQVQGKVFASTTGITGVRFSEICNSTVLDLGTKSNGRCCLPGHYVFETTESGTGIHKFCGNQAADNTCEKQFPTIDDSMNLNRNCREPLTPQETCDASTVCMKSGDSNQVTIFFKNAQGDRVAFYNYTLFTQTVPGGFVQPHGTNVTTLPGSVCSNIAVTVMNVTWQNHTRSSSGVSTSITCMTYDATTNSYKYVLRIWSSTNGINTIYDGSAFIVGVCDMDDLPTYITHSHLVGQVSTTTLPTRSGRTLSLYVSDRKSRTNEQSLSAGPTVVLGRTVFLRICFNRGTPFGVNADPYGIYGYSCWFSNNANFNNADPDFAMEVIGSDGCKASSSVGKAGELDNHFVADDASSTTNGMFCIVAGGVNLFKWIKKGDKIYARCSVNFCRNTGLFQYSRCKDSCLNSIIDSNTTDAGERRRRDIGDDGQEEVFTVVTVTEEDDNCVEPMMAKAVIGALVSLVAIATLAAVLLFWRLQKVKIH